MIRILPAYYFVNLVAAFIGYYDVKEVLILQPIELLGIQTWFETLFGIFHNGATWFVSCILFCYFIYPLANQLLSTSSKKKTIILLSVLLFIDAYSVLVRSTFSLASVYSSPLFRMVEFLAGTCLGRLKELFNNSPYQSRASAISFKNLERPIYETTSICLGLLIVVLYKNKTTEFWVDYIAGTLVCIFIFSLSLITREPPRKAKIIILEVENACYDVYLIQSIVWFPYGWLANKFPAIITRNLYALLFAFTLLAVLTTITHLFVEVPIQSFLKWQLSKFKEKKEGESRCYKY